MIRSKEQKELARRRSEILRYIDGKRATPSHFAHNHIAIFIHGFTADYRAMSSLADQFHGAGFETLGFNYPCFDGIDVAAQELQGQLQDINQICGGALTRNRLTLICHSMGGLVARALVSLFGGSQYVQNVVTLGTPHSGTLSEPYIIQYMIAASEFVSGVLSRGYSLTSKSALQLIGRDPEKLLDKLLKASPPESPVNFYSISGGKAWIENGDNEYVNRALNTSIQKAMRGRPNDGLVAEESSDLSQPKFSKCCPGAVHCNDYADYSRVNHSHLVYNYRVGLRALLFAQSSTSSSKG